MVRWGIWAAVLGACMGIAAHSAKRPAPVDILYPPPGAVFPPDIAPPAFTWTDTRATAWVIEAAGKRVAARGEPPQIGEIDPRCIAPSNDVPKLSAKEAAAHTWVPDAETWEAIKHASSGRPLTITITGFRDASMREAVSRGAVNVTTSKDPAGAPIFYRDVPLMPSETEKGVIKPLAENMTPLIRWRLRNIAEPGSRTLLENMPTCANCHSFSADGKALAMDLDGPQNDKGLYAIARIAPETSIRNEDVISWSGLDAQPAGRCGWALCPRSRRMAGT